MAMTIGSSIGIWIIYANLQWLYYHHEGRLEEGLAFAEEQLGSQSSRKIPS